MDIIFVRLSGLIIILFIILFLLFMIKSIDPTFLKFSNVIHIIFGWLKPDMEKKNLKNTSPSFGAGRPPKRVGKF